MITPKLTSKLTLYLLSLITAFFMAILILTCSAEAGQFHVPDTGQTKCYDDAGDEINPCPLPGEPFYGQDANYSINTSSYTKLDKNGNDISDYATSWAMVRDNFTRFIWEVKTNDRSIHDWDDEYNWHEAHDIFIAQLNAERFGGFSDWRLPTVLELASITDKGRFYPSIETDYFPNTKLWYYWSDTTYAYPTVNAWLIHFYYGPDGQDDKLNNYHVRAVRSGQSLIDPSDNFLLNIDGTVTDKNTGLTWQRETGGTMNWQDALSYCESLSLGGYDNWRLPTIEELRSIVNYRTFDPAIASIFVQDPDNEQYYTIDGLYWSSTTYAYYTDRAWGTTYFHYGYSTHNHKFDKFNVRAVRSGQSDTVGKAALKSNTDDTAVNADGVDNTDAAINAATACTPEGLYTQYEAGKQFCIDNPEKCGITIASLGGALQGALNASKQVKDDESAASVDIPKCEDSLQDCPPIILTKDFKMHIPMLNYSTPLVDISLWADFELVPGKNGELFWNISAYGENE